MLPFFLLMLARTAAVQPDAASTPSLADTALRQVLRAQHLRGSSDGVVRASFGCAAALPHCADHLVVCDPSGAQSSVVCAAAAALGFHVLAASPAVLFEQEAHLGSLLSWGKRTVTFIGGLRGYSRTGTLRRIRERFPRIERLLGIVADDDQALLGTEEGAAIFEGALLHVTEIPFASLPFQPDGGSRLNVLPALPGIPAALSFRRLSLEAPHIIGGVGSRLQRPVVGVLVVGTHPREWRTAEATISSLVRGDGRLLVDVVVVSPASSPDLSSPTTLMGTPLVYLNLSCSEDTARRLSQLDALIAVPEGELPQVGGFLAAPLLAALASGTPVLIPAALSTPDMLRYGMTAYDGSLQMVLREVLGLRQIAQDSLLSLNDTRDGSSSATTPFVGAQPVSHRNHVRRQCDVAYAAAAVTWRRALMGETSASAVTEGGAFTRPPVFAGGGGGGGGAAPLGRRCLALYASELAPTTRGGAGVVASALAIELLLSGVDVVVIAALPRSQSEAWLAFATQHARAGVGGVSTGVLTVLCVADLLGHNATTFSATPPLSFPHLLPWRSPPLPPAEAYAIDEPREEPRAALPYRHEDLAAAVEAAAAVAAAYQRLPFESLEFFDFFGPAFGVLYLRRHGAVAAGNSRPFPSLPSHVRVLIRAHGSMEAINEVEAPGPPSRFNAVRHGMERYSLAAADAVLVQTEALREPYARAYGLEPARVWFAPPPMHRIAQLFQQPVATPPVADSAGRSTANGGGEKGGGGDGRCGVELAALPMPCGRRRDVAGGGAPPPGCKVFLSLGKLQRVKGPLTIARAFASLPPTSDTTSSSTTTHLLYVGGDAFSQEHGHSVSTCVRELLPRSQRRRVHVVPSLSQACVGAAVGALHPVAAVFGSEFETFHLAAHEMAALGVPQLLPDLPVYAAWFRRDDVYWYAGGDSSSLAGAMAAVLRDAAAGDRLLRRVGLPIDYGDALRVYGAPPLVLGPSAPSHPPPMYALTDALSAAVAEYEAAASDACVGRGRHRGGGAAGSGGWP